MRSPATTPKSTAGPGLALLTTLLGIGTALAVHAVTADYQSPETSLRLSQSEAQGQRQGQGQQKAKEKQTVGDQEDRPAQDRDRDQDRVRDRPDDAQPIYGRELMTEQERREYHERMRNLRTEEERRAYREEHHRQMQSRAAERGLTLPEPSPQTAPGNARQQRDSDKGE